MAWCPFQLPLQSAGGLRRDQTRALPPPTPFGHAPAPEQVRPPFPAPLSSLAKELTRSVHGTDSFQRWQRQQQEIVKASNSCHVLVMNLVDGSHAAAKAEIAQLAGAGLLA
jgi:hypothetical protein